MSDSEIYMLAFLYYIICHFILTLYFTVYGSNNYISITLNENETY